MAMALAGAGLVLQIVGLVVNTLAVPTSMALVALPLWLVAAALVALAVTWYAIARSTASVVALWCVAVVVLLGCGGHGAYLLADVWHQAHLP